MFFSKYDSSGNFLLAHNIGAANGHNTATDIKLNSKGDLIICGRLSGIDVDFDPGAGKFLLSSGPAYYPAGYIAAYKNNGSFLSAIPITSPGYFEMNINSLALDASDNVYIAGDYSGNFDFDPGNKVVNLQAPAGLFFASYSKSASLRMVKGIATNTYTSSISGIALDDNRNIYVGGYFGSQKIDCDPGPDSAILINEYYDQVNQSNTDLFLAKYDAFGNYRFSYDFDGDTTSGLNYSSSVNVDKAGNIIFSGYGEANIDFDLGMDSILLHPATAYSFFLAKYSPVSLTVKPNNKTKESIANNTININNSDLSFYPNPVSDHLFLTIKNIKESAGKAQAAIYNAQGICIKTEQLIITNHTINENINLSAALANGNYFITIKTADAQYKTTFTKQ